MVAAGSELLTYRRGAFGANVSAIAEANAQAVFDLRRGIRAEAGASASAELVAQLELAPDGEKAAALVRAQAGATARAAFAAQLDVHGLFAEAMAAIQARARVQGDISMTGAVLAALLDDELRPFLQRPAAALLRKPSSTPGPSPRRTSHSRRMHGSGLAAASFRRLGPTTARDSRSSSSTATPTSGVPASTAMSMWSCPTPATSSTRSSVS